MEENLKQLLKDGIKQIDESLLNENLVKKLELFYNQITLFNPVYKLVAAEGKDLVVKHLLDSLAPFPVLKKYLPENASVADLGSGSGLPGFVLASAMDGCRFSLVDKMGRRIGFLRNTVALSGMSQRISIVESEVEKLDSTFDGVVFRAFRPMEDIIESLDRITKPSSYVFAYKSQEENISNEISVVEKYGKFKTEVVSYDVPFLDAKRSLLILKKLA